MRWLSFICAAWFVCSNLLANTAGISIPTRLQGTAVGQRVVEIYGGLLGQEIGFFMGGIDYTGKIAEVILPDISKFIESGDQDDAQLKLGVSDVVATDPQAVEGDLPKIIEGEVVRFASLADFTGLLPAVLMDVSSEASGKNISLVRLLAGLGKDDEEVGVEALVEIERHGDRHTVLEEPFITKLLASEFMYIHLTSWDGVNGVVFVPGSSLGGNSTGQRRWA